MRMAAVVVASYRYDGFQLSPPRRHVDLSYTGGGKVGKFSKVVERPAFPRPISCRISSKYSVGLIWSKALWASARQQMPRRLEAIQAFLGAVAEPSTSSGIVHGKINNDA